MLLEDGAHHIAFCEEDPEGYQIFEYTKVKSVLFDRGMREERSPNILVSIQLILIWNKINYITSSLSAKLWK